VERREHTRHTIWFPVTLTLGSTEVWAICRDASGGGIRISSTTELEVGAIVSVVFRVTPGDAKDHVVRGRIVRIEAASRAGGTWPHEIAIEFDEAQPSLEAQLRSDAS
jgi:hypothetical protein